VRVYLPSAVNTLARNDTIIPKSSCSIQAGKETHIMNAFENIAIGLLQAAEVEAPLFIKSPQGTLILNASEVLLASILARFAPAPPAALPAPAPATPVSSS
jgi:hypothetical protein